MGILSFLNPASLWVKVVDGLLILSLIGGAYWYVQNLNHKVTLRDLTIVALKEEISTKDFIISSYETVFKHKMDDAKLARQVNTDLTTKWETAQKEKTNLSRRLTGLVAQIKNLTNKVMMMEVPLPGVTNPPPTVSAETQTLEITINSVNKEMLRCNELVTGAMALPADLMNGTCADFVKVKVAP